MLVQRRVQGIGGTEVALTVRYTAFSDVALHIVCDTADKGSAPNALLW